MPSTWPGRHAQVTSLQHFGAVGAIAERDVLEADLAAQRRQRRRGRAQRRLRRGVQDVAEPLDRNPRLLEVLPQLRQPQHRRADAPGEHVERDQLADRHRLSITSRAPKYSVAAVTSLLTSCTHLAGPVAERERR